MVTLRFFNAEIWQEGGTNSQVIKTLKIYSRCHEQAHTLINMDGNLLPGMDQIREGMGQEYVRLRIMFLQ